MSLDQRIKLWAEACDAEEQRVLAELRAQIGPEGDLRAAYREWLRKQSDIKEQETIQFLKNLGEKEAAWRAREAEEREKQSHESTNLENPSQ